MSSQPEEGKEKCPYGPATGYTGLIVGKGPCSGSLALLVESGPNSAMVRGSSPTRPLCVKDKVSPCL